MPLSPCGFKDSREFEVILSSKYVLCFLFSRNKCVLLLVTSASVRALNYSGLVANNGFVRACKQQGNCREDVANGQPIGK